jgi:hypothetical protein
MTSCFTKGHDTQKELIKTSALKEDFDILRTTLQEAHRGLYWYSDTTALQAYLNKVRAGLNDDLSQIEFFKIMLPVISYIRCSHTNIRLPASSDASANQFTRVLPFETFYWGGKLYIRKGFTTDEYDGMEIISINNINIERLTDTILNSLPADGYNQTFKHHLLNKGAFREGYAMYFGQPESFTIQAKGSSGQPSIFNIRAVPPQDVASIRSNLPTPFILSFRGNAAILAINTFQFSTSEFRDSVSILFNEINKRGVNHLIIDLRQNGGGRNDNVSTLYSYIAAAPFRHLKSVETTSAAITYRKYVTNWQSFSSFLNGTGTSNSINDRYAGTKIKSPAQKDLFRGDVVLLVSGNTASAASEFAAIFRYLKRGQLVGEETGGCYYGGTGGNYLNLKLPHSQLEVRIPTIKILTAVDEDYQHQPKGRGTLPDYPVLPTIKDVVSGKDVQLEAAIQLLSDQL